jgi:hypothetical protein
MHVFALQDKVPDIEGYVKYCSSDEKQEDIICAVRNIDCKSIAEYEFLQNKNNIQAKTLKIALPNVWIGKGKDYIQKRTEILVKIILGADKYNRGEIDFLYIVTS